MIALMVCMGAMNIQLKRKLDSGYTIDRKASREVRNWQILSVTSFAVALILPLLNAFGYESVKDIWPTCGFMLGLVVAILVFGTSKISDIKDSLSPSESSVIEDNGQDIQRVDP